MTHRIDGFTADFTHRGSWKAHLYRDGTLVDTVPVTWTKGTRRETATKEWFQRVWFSKQEEIDAALTNPKPFLVIVALAEEYRILPHSVKHMNAVYRVIPTGESAEPQTIECKVLERIRA